MPEAATVGVLRKKVFFKISQNSQEETSVNFANFLRTLFLQKNSGQLLLNSDIAISEAKDIDCICCRELDAVLISSAKIQSTREESHHSAFMGIYLIISHTY